MSFINFPTHFIGGSWRQQHEEDGLEIPHGFQQSVIVPQAPHQDGPSKVGDVVTPPGPWLTPIQRMQAAPNRPQKANGWSCSLQQWYTRQLHCDCLSNSHRPGMALLYVWAAYRQTQITKNRNIKI